MSDKPCCGNCRFWGERGGVATFVEGEEEVCLRYPPTVPGSHTELRLF
jgi:hypothetical protein